MSFFRGGTAPQTELSFAVPVHHLYRKHYGDWRFHRLMHEGSREYFEEHLERHSVEDLEDWAARYERAVHPNFLKIVLETYAGSLFRTPVIRTEPSAKLGGEAFYDDLDLQGNSADDFFEQAAILCQREGRACVLVDRFDGDNMVERRSAADDMELGVRPFYRLILAENLINWSVDSFGVFRWAMIREEGDDPDREYDDESTDAGELYRLWYPDRWELYKTQTRENEEGESYTDLVFVEDGVNPLGEVPLVFMYFSTRTTSQPVGEPTTSDIPRLNRRLTNLYSYIDEQITQYVFSLLVADQPTVEALKASRFAVNGVLGIPEESTMKPYYLAPQVDQIQAIRTEIEATEHLVRVLSGLARSSEQSAQQPSGIALAHQSMDKISRLRKYAGKLETLERECMRLAYRWMNLGESVPEPVARYTREFIDADSAALLEESVMFGALPLAGEAKLESLLLAVQAHLGTRITPERLREIEDDVRERFAMEEEFGGTVEEALNGAQMKSMVEVGAMVQSGELNIETGIAILVRGVGMDEASARAALSSAAAEAPDPNDAPPTPPPPFPPPTPEEPSEELDEDE